MAVQFSHRPQSFKSLLAGGLGIASLIGITACAPEQIDADTQEVDINVEEVAEETEALEGQAVALRGKFLADMGETAFKLREDTLFPDDDILVVNVTGNDYAVPSGEATPMWVTGTVEKFERETMSDKYELTLDPNLYEEFEGQPVVVANYIALAPDPEEVSENPEAFYGQRVVVDGEVETIFAPDAFSLENEQLFDGTGLLVVGAVPDPIKAGPASVSGVLQTFSLAALEAEYDILWEPELRDTLVDAYTGQPFILVQEIYPFTE